MIFQYYNSLDMTLAEIQAKIKVGKDSYNKFGEFSYRSCEDILEVLKPIINPKGGFVTFSDDVISVGGEIYIKAVATVTIGEKSWSSVSIAREEKSRPKMAAPQLTGSSSSYARKYALQGLLALDDGKHNDPDSRDNSGNYSKKENAKQSTTPKNGNKQAPAQSNQPEKATEAQIKKLREQMNGSFINDEEREATEAKIKEGISKNTANVWINKFETLIEKREQQYEAYVAMKEQEGVKA